METEGHTSCPWRAQGQIHLCTTRSLSMNQGCTRTWKWGTRSLDVRKDTSGTFPPPPILYQVDASAAPGTEDTETEGASGTLLASSPSSALTSHPLLLKQEPQGVPWKALTQ